MQALQGHSDPTPVPGPLATRVRLRYRKRDKLRFVSAIDLGRVWERAVRKADLPVAYSEGFSPHPKISFTDALPLGYASDAEYAEVTFAGAIHLATAMATLNEAFPTGVAVLDAVGVDDGAPKFAKLLLASCWDIDYPETPAGALAAAVAAADAADSLVVQRQRKGEPMPVELRPAIACIATRASRVRVVLQHVEPAVRPTEVDLALRSFYPGLPEPALVTRVAQGTATPNGLIEALSGTRIDVVPPASKKRLPT